jgi:CBS domain-containing protein
VLVYGADIWSSINGTETDTQRGVWGLEQQDIRELRVGEIMETDWPTLGPESTIEEAIKLFAEARISGAPVVEGERLVGIITEGDLIFQDADIKAPGFLDILGGIIPLGNTVGEVMTGDPITVLPEATLAETATVMAEKRKKILPVVEGERLAGVITRMDILTLHVLKPRL